jgi:hypothetical protein
VFVVICNMHMVHCCILQGQHPFGNAGRAAGSTGSHGSTHTTSETCLPNPLSDLMLAAYCRANTPSVKLAGLQAALAVMAVPTPVSDAYIPDRSSDLQHGALLHIAGPTPLL